MKCPLVWVKLIIKTDPYEDVSTVKVLISVGRQTHLGRHVAFSADAVGRRHVDGVAGHIVPDRQAQVADHACQVQLHQDVLGLEIAVRDGRFACDLPGIHS